MPAEEQKVEETAADISILREYQETKDTELRNDILMNYLYIARSAAVQMRGILPNAIQEEDLVNQGVLALMECMERYDESKGAKFETYAFLRVKGALIDYIRKQDWVPHRTRRLGKQIEKTYMEIANEKMREPSMEEVAARMEISGEKLNANLRAINNSMVLSFENVIQDMTMFMAKTEMASQDHSVMPEDNVFQQEMKQMLARAIEGLSEKERLVITFYYYEELKYAQIAEILEIGESRVCQIHTKAILKLKLQLEDYMKG